MEFILSVVRLNLLILVRRRGVHIPGGQGFLVTSLIGFCIHFVFKFCIQLFCLLGKWRLHFIREANKDVSVEQVKMAIIVNSDSYELVFEALCSRLVELCCQMFVTI